MSFDMDYPAYLAENAQKTGKINDRSQQEAC